MNTDALLGSHKCPLPALLISCGRPASWTLERHLVWPGEPWRNVPSPVWRAHDQLGGLLFHGVLRQHGERARQDRGILLLVGANHSA